MNNNFIVDIIGQMPLEQIKQVSDILTPQLIKLGLKLQFRIADEKKDISTAYHDTFNGHMLIVYGMPYNLPHFGSLSQELFGLRELENSGKTVKKKEYPKKIYVIPNNRYRSLHQ